MTKRSDPISRRSALFAGLGSVSLILAFASFGNDAGERGRALAKQAQERAAEVKAEIKLQPNSTAVDQASVEALAAKGRERGKQTLEALREKGYLGLAPDGSPLVEATKKQNEAFANPVSGRVVVALSSSMPDAMLRTYIQQLAGKRESIIVLRGFVGGAHKVEPTTKFMESALRVDPLRRDKGHFNVETVVDPLIYAQLGIDKVPAVAYLPGVQELAHCDDEDYSKAVVIFGATSIEAALKKAKKEGAAVPASVLARYRGKGWEQSKASQ